MKECSMKKYSLIAILLLVFVSLFARSNDIRYVSVEQVFVKTGTNFFSRKIAELYYGQEVILLSEKGNWCEIEVSSNIRGWVSKTSVTSKKIIIRDKNVTTTTDELALAGKGFNQEVENYYEEEKSIDFSLVDSIEEIYVDEKILQDFILQGQLNGVEK